MPVAEAQEVIDTRLAPEDELRAHLYRLVARFLSAAPDRADLTTAAGMNGDDSALGQAVQSFAHLCARTDPGEVSREYHDLFIGVGRGELLPFGSYYLTGFLHEKPLAKLREDMAQLGIEQTSGVSEPEDHVAALMDMMAGLITGDFGPPATLQQQRAFFETHLATWAGHFFADLEAAKSSVLYAALGTVGRLFLEIEETAFSMT